LRLQAHWSPFTTNTQDLGTSIYKWKDLYLEGDVKSFDDLIPRASNVSTLGSAANYMFSIYSNYVYYTTLTAFDAFDDISLIKKIKMKKSIVQEPTKLASGKYTKGNKINKDIWDETTMPQEVYKDGFYDAGSLNGLVIGTLKQLITKVEQLEQKMINN